MKKTLAVAALVAGSFFAVSCSNDCDRQGVEVLRTNGQPVTIYVCVVEPPAELPEPTPTRPPMNPPTTTLPAPTITKTTMPSGTFTTQ